MAAPLGSGMSQESMMKQASQIWTMLDEMAADNPEAYRKFIDKQKADAEAVMAPPKPHMCLQTTLTEDARSVPMFINVFEWVRLPAPKTDEDPIPVVAGPPYEDTDEQGKFKMVSVAFNPEVLQQFGIDSQLSTERKMLINLAIDFLQEDRKLSVSRNYTLLGKDNICKGSVERAKKTLLQKFNPGSEPTEPNLEEMEKTFGSLASGSKESLFSKLSNITGSGDVERTPGEQVKPRLIQDMDFVKGGPRKPQCKLVLKDGEGDEKPRRIVMRISLPEVMSVAQCELDISQRDLHLSVEDMYQLTEEFPEAVDSTDAQAKFSRKSSTLTLTLPTIKQTPS